VWCSPRNFSYDFSQFIIFHFYFYSVMRRSLLLSVVLLFVSFGVSFAQNGVVRGKVTDKKNGEGLQGARVTLTLQSNPTTKLGRVSGKDGSFEILNVPSGRYTAEATYVGYRITAQPITVDGGATLETNFPLILDPRGLDEVVVTGIASRNTKAVAEVSVGRVDAAGVTDKVGFSTAGQLLQGKVAGVTITPATGQVGGGLRFNIRSGAGLTGGGGSNPLIFVDGALINAGNFGNGGLTGIASGGQQTSALADLNPNDIEDIQILKGPAASALYGPQAQNGVVLITTKRGRSAGNNEITLNYQGQFGASQIHRQYTANDLESWREMNALFRQGRIIQHNVNLSGASGIFNYYVGYENRQEEGTVIQSQLGRETVRLNLDAVATQGLTLKASGSYTRNKIGRPQNDNNLNGWLTNANLWAPFTNPSGAAGAAGLSTPNRAYRTVFQFQDSAAIAALENDTQVDRFIGSFEANFRPTFIPGLTLRGVAGFDLSGVRNTSFQPSNFNYPGVVRGQRLALNFGDNRTNFDLQATYEWNVPGFVKGTSILGTQLINRTFNNTFLSAQNYPTELIRDVSAGDATTRQVSEYAENTRTAGIIVRQELAFFDNLFSLSGGIRNDYSTQYGVDVPSIIYPQVGGMLRLDKLGILPEFINEAKFRASYGQSGRLPGILDGQRLVWTTAQSPSGAGAVLNNTQGGIGAGNTSIAAERVQEVEVGLDVEFENTYGFEFTYYIQNTSGGLLNAPRAPSTGLGARPVNIGRVDGWGFESLIYAHPIQTKEFGLDLTFILNYADNVVRDVGFSAGASEFLTDGFTVNYLIPGERRSQFMGLRPLQPRLRADGYYDIQNPWRPGIEIDTAGARRAASGALIGYSLGSAVPIFTGSFTINFKFLTDFNFYVLTDFALGQSLLNDNRRFFTNPAYSNSPRFNVLATQLGIFGSGVNATNGAAAQERGPAAQISTGRVPGVAVLTPNTPEYAAAAREMMQNDYRFTNVRFANFGEKADWARIREVSVSWNATSTVNAIFGSTLKKLSFGASVTNLALFTTYKGAEVEINSAPSNAISAGQDFFTLPQSRIFNFIVSFGL
jgi:TonB-dependent starch-binding outer membrane protein SusC